MSAAEVRALVDETAVMAFRATEAELLAAEQSIPRGRKGAAMRRRLERLWSEHIAHAQAWYARRGVAQ